MKLFVITDPFPRLHGERIMFFYLTCTKIDILEDKIIISSMRSCVESGSLCGVSVYANTTSLVLEIRRLR